MNEKRNYPWWLLLLGSALLAGPALGQEEPGETQEPPPEEDAVDLSGEELPALYQEEQAPAQVLARPWYQNIDISGFGAFWLARSGADGTRPDAGFAIKEASLFVEAEVWEDIALFFEIQIPPLQQDHSTPVRTGEVYAHFRNLLRQWGDGLLGVKMGRIDIPFGEEYLWQDAPDNPLISNSAAYPWLWDEGITLYGRLGELGWVAAIMDGTIRRSQEDGPAKALIARVYGTPWKSLYLSASAMKNGATAAGALLLGGSLFKPVGSGAASSAGASPSGKVDARLYELDARFTPARRARLDLAFGQAWIDDPRDAFDRRLTWFSAQPLYQLTNRLHATLRYSEIGTYDADEGYQLDGEFLAGGETFGYDVRRLLRLALGMGWKPNPRTRIKFEMGRDWFTLIDASPLKPGNDRESFVVELAVSF